MPWDIGAGVAAAAGAGAGLIGDSIKRERNLEDATNLEALKSKIEQDKQARVAAVLASVSRTKTVDISGPTEDGSSLGTTEQAKPEAEYRRERGDALSKAGMIDHSEREYAAADRSDDKHELRTTQAAAQKSADEKWKATHEETKRFHDATIRQQASQLGLKAQEAKDFATVSDSYVTNKSEYERLVALKDDPDLIAAAKQQMEKDALKLKQFRVDVGNDTSEFAKHLNLSATLEKLNKTIADPMTDAGTIVKAKAARDNVLTQMTAATGSKGSAGAPGEKYTVGQVVPSPKGDMEYLGDNKWRAAKGAPAAANSGGKPAASKSEEPATSRPFPDVKIKEGGLIDTAAKYYGSNDPQRAYLQGKIARNEELTPSEKVRAQRLKLL
jgi:hypothetical protein